MTIGCIDVSVVMDICIGLEKKVGAMWFCPVKN